MLLKRFRPSQEGTMYEALLTLRQVGTVRDYRRQFETMALLLMEVSEQVLKSSFINGLKPEIQAKLLMLQPMGLGRLMALAQWVDERNMKLKQAKYALGPANSRPTNQTISHTHQGTRPYPILQSGQPCLWNRRERGRGRCSSRGSQRKNNGQEGERALLPL